MTLSNKTYDILKWIALYLLPALGTLYFTLSGLWGLPYGEQIVGTITALDTFVAVIIGISAHNYKGEGTLRIDTSDPNTDVYRFDLGDMDLADLSKYSKVTLLVDNNAHIDPGVAIDQETLKEALR